MSGGFVNLGLEDEEVKGQGRRDLLTSSQSELVNSCSLRMMKVNSFIEQRRAAQALLIGLLDRVPV